jgi:hypothetical protein
MERLFRNHAEGKERARLGHRGPAPSPFTPLATQTDSLFSDSVGGGATRRGRRVATPGAGVVPISNWKDSAY